MMERLYRFLNQEKGDRICNGISNEACEHAPKNYFMIIITSMFTKLGDVLSAPKTVLTWVMGSIGAPIFLTSLLVPIRESGSMLPQAFLSKKLRNLTSRKWGWVIGSLLQAFSLISIVATVSIFSDARAGIWIVIFVAVFSLGRAMCSLLSKDVIGKSIPKTRRGKLNGYASSLSGVLVLISGITLLFHPLENSSLNSLLILITIAGALWILAALFFAQVYEIKSNLNKQPANQPSFFTLIKTDKILQKFILARGLLISSALLSPLIVLLAQKNVGTDIYILGLFILAGGTASIISGPFWGHMADRSSKKVMITAASIVAVLSIIVSMILLLDIPAIGQVWLYPILLFVLGVAHDGIRLGRKTYIVDIAEGETRTQYVATSNTAIGFLLLIIGVFTAWLSSLSLVVAILVLTVMVVAGIWFSWRLPDVE